MHKIYTSLFYLRPVFILCKFEKNSQLTKPNQKETIVRIYKQKTQALGLNPN